MPCGLLCQIALNNEELPYAERHVRWCERSENESRKKTFVSLLLDCYAPAMASQDPSYTEAVVPQNKDLGTVRKSFVFTMPENSVGVLKLTPVESR